MEADQGRKLGLTGPRRFFMVNGRALATVAAFLCAVSFSPVSHGAGPVRHGGAANQALAAVARAAQAQRYLFVFFYKSDDESTRAMGDVFNRATRRVFDRADSIAVMTTNPAERGIVAKFGVDRAPMPLVLVLAPNGAITGSFHTTFTEDQLLQAKHVDTLGEIDFDYVVTLCDHAQETCPFFPAKTRLLHRGFDDPPKLATSTNN
jgi:hypothetical protein